MLSSIVIFNRVLCLLDNNEDIREKTIFSFSRVFLIFLIFILALNNVFQL